MRLLIDTSVWSEALRRKGKDINSEDSFLYHLIQNEEEIYLTGIILQEILSGIKDPKIFSKIQEQFRYFDFVIPSIIDHIEAAKLRNSVSKKGITLATVDALIAQLAISNNMPLITYDNDFSRLIGLTKLKILTFDDYRRKKGNSNVD